MTWFSFRGRAGLAFLPVVTCLPPGPSIFAADNREKDPDEIGIRDVGKGVNFTPWIRRSPWKRCGD